MESLIDPRSTPYSAPEEIAAEIEEIRRLPQSAGRDHTIKLMQSWLDDPQGRKSEG